MRGLSVSSRMLDQRCNIFKRMITGPVLTLRAPRTHYKADSTSNPATAGYSGRHGALLCVTEDIPQNLRGRIRAVEAVRRFCGCVCGHLTHAILPAASWSDDHHVLAQEHPTRSEHPGRLRQGARCGSPLATHRVRPLRSPSSPGGRSVRLIGNARVSIAMLPDDGVSLETTSSRTPSLSRVG